MAKAILLASSVVVDKLAQSPPQVKSLLQKVQEYIVRLDRIKGFNLVNLEMGYREIVILSPMEVRFDE